MHCPYNHSSFMYEFASSTTLSWGLDDLEIIEHDDNSQSRQP